MSKDLRKRKHIEHLLDNKAGQNIAIVLTVKSLTKENADTIAAALLKNDREVTG